MAIIKNWIIHLRRDHNFQIFVVLDSSSGKKGSLRSDTHSCLVLCPAHGWRQNRFVGKGIKDFHLWEDTMKKHPRRNVIMVIGHTRLFNQCFFSTTPMPLWMWCWLPGCNVQHLPVPVLCTELQWSRHFSEIWWSAQHRGVDAARSQHDRIFEGSGFVISFIKVLSSSKMRQNLSGLWRINAVFTQFPVMKKSCCCWKAGWIFSFFFWYMLIFLFFFYFKKNQPNNNTRMREGGVEEKP